MRKEKRRNARQHAIIYEERIAWALRRCTTCKCCVWRVNEIKGWTIIHRSSPSAIGENSVSFEKIEEKGLLWNVFGGSKGGSSRLQTSVVLTIF